MLRPLHAGIGSLIASVPLVLWLLSMPTAREVGAPPPRAPEPPSLVGPFPPLELPFPRVTLLLEKGDTLAGKLLAAGLSESELTQVVAKVAGVLDVRKLVAGTDLEVEFDTTGDFRQLAIRKQDAPIARVERRGEELTANLETLPTQLRVESLAGEVRASLWDTLDDLGERPELAVELSKLFQWQVDFSRELQPGDRFSIAVEKHTCEGRLVGYGRILAATLENKGVEHTAILYDATGTPGYWNEDGESQRRAFLRCPVSFTRISSGFTNRRLHPVLGVNRPHWGVDFAAPAGTPVMAAGDGKVTFAGWSGGFGRSVSLTHGGDTVTMYGHLSGIARGIRPGSSVSQGQVIGYVGATGLATGPHLDFRFRRDGKYLDPMKMLDSEAPARRLSDTEMRRFEHVRDRLLGSLDDLKPGDRRLVAIPDAG